MSTMRDRTVFITGASRGIGRAIALAAARQGANVVIAAKSYTRVAAPNQKFQNLRSPHTHRPRRHRTRNCAVPGQPAVLVRLAPPTT